VSWEFLQHLESIADSNKDGTVDANEFQNAQNADLVLLEPGCDWLPGLRAQFPNVGLEESARCDSGHRHGYRRASFAPHARK
jgi:hypothetical protein